MPGDPYLETLVAAHAPTENPVTWPQLRSASRRQYAREILLAVAASQGLLRKTFFLDSASVDQVDAALAALGIPATQEVHPEPGQAPEREQRDA